MPLRATASPRVVAVLATLILSLLAGGVHVLARTAPAAEGGAAPVATSAELVDLEARSLEVAEPMPAPEEPDARWLDALADRAERGPARSPAPAAPAAEPAAAPQPDVASESERHFAAAHPEHAAARQVDGDPASFHWAVLIGVNDYAGGVGDTFGSVPDAEVLRDILIDHGWRPDHVLLLTDASADHDGIVRAFEWLARSTDERSTVVVSSSGHIRHTDGRTGLWPADSRFIWSEDLGRMLGAIPSERMWITLQGCHAGGLAGPGLEGSGRIVTYSSPVEQKSFEDPDTQHSLQGYYLFAEGIRDGWADADGDGRVSVQEAFAWGAPRAEIRSGGRQVPVLVDGMAEPFHLEVPQR